MDLGMDKGNTLLGMGMFLVENSNKIKNMALGGLFIMIRVSTMDNGFKEKNKVKACIFIQIKMYFRVIGWMVKNMDQGHMYFQQQGWNTSGNGMKTSF